MGRTEPAGFREFVEARSPALLRTAWLLTGDWPRAEDLLQTALTKSWPHWSRIRDGNPEGYVRRALVNAYRTWRRRPPRAETPSRALPDRIAAGDPQAAADLLPALIAALSTLPRRQRAVVVLRYYDDLSEAQVAELLACSAGTVKSQAAKALAKLRSCAELVSLTMEDTAP